MHRVGHRVLGAAMTEDTGQGEGLSLNMGPVLAPAFCLLPSIAELLVDPSWGSGTDSSPRLQRDRNAALKKKKKIPPGVDFCPGCLLAGALASMAAHLVADGDWRIRSRVLSGLWSLWHH